MRTDSGSRRLLVAVTTAVLAVAWQFAPASAGTAPISSDPFSQATCVASATTNHATEVEPDTFSNGSTIVAAFQVGRIYDGGACAIGFATTTNNGGSWTSGLLPGLTKYFGNGNYDRATDPSVAYDAALGRWLVSSLVLTESGGVTGRAVLTSASSDGVNWGSPTMTASHGDMDKNWIVCDNSSSSNYRGTCYTQWDDHGAGNLLHMAVSTDGGAHWATSTTTGNYGVIGGQPVVAPNGTVIVPVDNANETALGAFTSTDAGATWSAITTITSISHHRVAGSLREGPLPSAEIDGTGTVYVAWTDCRFERGCKANDIVLSHAAAPYASWSPVSPVPIDPARSGVDHFLPGLGVNRATSGTGAQFGVTYYFYPAHSSQLSVGFVSTTDAGAHWSTPQTVASGMPTGWLATTSQGRMVGDYMSTSYGSDNLAHGVFVTAAVPTTGGGTSCTTTALDNCVESASTFTSGLAAGAVSSGNAPALYGSGGSSASAASLWNVVDNNGIRHR